MKEGLFSRAFLYFIKKNHSSLIFWVIFKILNPHSAHGNTEIERLYFLKLKATSLESQISKYQKELDSLRTIQQSDHIQSDKTNLETKIHEWDQQKTQLLQELNQAMKSSSEKKGGLQSYFLSFQDGLFHQTFHVNIKNGRYANGDESKKQSVFLPLPILEEVSLKINYRAESEIFHLKFKCQGQYEEKSFFGYKKFQAQELYFRTHSKDVYNDIQFNFRFFRKSLPCEFTFTDANRGEEHKLLLLSETILTRTVNHIRRGYEVCSLPVQTGVDESYSLFDIDSAPHLSCAQSGNDPEILHSPEEALQKRISLLTDQSFDYEAILHERYQIDPLSIKKIDLIVISSLIASPGKVTKLLVELLQLHARRGIPIYLFFSESLAGKKDKEKFLELANDFPNVKLKYFDYSPPHHPGFQETLAKFHRSNHVKIFATYEEDGNNSLGKFKSIIGGRNLADDYFFAESIDSHKRKFTREKVARLEDMDFLIEDSHTARSIIQHFFSFFDADETSYFMRPSTLNLPIFSPAEFFQSSLTQMRHFISLPFTDGERLESMISDYILSAKKSISIVTPYFNLTPRLQEALETASRKKIQIKIITDLSLDGDTADFILGDFNKYNYNKVKDFAEFYALQIHPRTLHTKFIRIDDDISIVGSVNFNQRSFFHDTENVLLVRSQTFNNKLRAIQKSYIKSSVKLETHQDVNVFKKFFIRMHGKEF
jgi:phosphatidylserine/phosphatidylglycerophosphate/cardiolipin synthase-like enzyme